MASDVARVSRRMQAAKETAVLDLSGCKLKSLPQALFLVLRSGLTSITTVDLSDNVLEKVSPKIQRFTAVERLVLRGNSIASWDFLELVPTVTELVLDSCDLGHLPPQLFALPNLKHLSLQGNSIRDFDVEKTRAWEQLQSLDVTGNPLEPSVVLQLQTRPFSLTL